MLQRSAGKALAFNYVPTGQNGVFRRLFSVTIRHSYYARNLGLCPDFKIIPTPSTATLLASLGLVFKDEGTGFSVFVSDGGVPALIDYLYRHVQDGAGAAGFWTRLSFLLIPVNPLFVGLTALPIDTDPTTRNLYICNRQAHAQAAEVNLAAGAFVDAAALYPIVGPSVSLTIPPGAIIVITDISGAVVSPAMTGDSFVSLDLSSLPYGLYTLALVWPDGTPAPSPDLPLTLLYMPVRPITLGLVDMLLTQPRPDLPGIYPVPPLFDAPPAPATVGGIAYALPFDARATYWHYYIVSQHPGGVFTDLAIDGPGARFKRENHPVMLPNGSLATLFRGKPALPLRQQSPQRFRLRGQRHARHRVTNEVLVTCLPVAPGTPVWPGPSEETGTSEMYVYV